MEESDQLCEIEPQRRLNFDEGVFSTRNRPSSTSLESLPLKVFARLRPPVHSAAQAERCLVALPTAHQIQVVPPSDFNISASQRNIDRSKYEATYTFDTVLTEHDSQAEVFDLTGRPLADALMMGQNGLLFAYGITGAGKTYTIQGTESSPGVLPRLLEVLIENVAELKRAQPELCPSLYISYLEVYQEQIFDLLNPVMVEGCRSKLDIKEEKNISVVKGLSEWEATSLHECKQMIREVPPVQSVAIPITRKRDTCLRSACRARTTGQPSARTATRSRAGVTRSSRSRTAGASALRPRRMYSR
jgi:hypothetical protein